MTLADTEWRSPAVLRRVIALAVQVFGALLGLRGPDLQVFLVSERCSEIVENLKELLIDLLSLISLLRLDFLRGMSAVLKAVGLLVKDSGLFFVQELGSLESKLFAGREYIVHWYYDHTYDPATYEHERVEEERGHDYRHAEVGGDEGAKEKADDGSECELGGFYLSSASTFDRLFGDLAGGFKGRGKYPRYENGEVLSGRLFWPTTGLAGRLFGPTSGLVHEARRLMATSQRTQTTASIDPKISDA